MPKTATAPTSYLSVLLGTATADLAQARANLDRANEARMKAEGLLSDATAEAEHYSARVNEIVQTIKTLGGDAKGFKPIAHAIGNVEAETDSPDYAAMTVRAACRTYFANNNNEPVHYRDMTEAIGKSKGTVASILSIYPEFISNNPGSGEWLMDPAFYNAGWTTVGN
jgi:hypothetical protein